LIHIKDIRKTPGKNPEGSLRNQKTSPEEPEKILKEREKNQSQYNNTSTLDVGLLLHVRV
jgi:hypothetical protein